MNHVIFYVQPDYFPGQAILLMFMLVNFVGRVQPLFKALSKSGNNHKCVCLDMCVGVFFSVFIINFAHCTSI